MAVPAWQDDFPGQTGAYVILVELVAALPLDGPRLAAQSLAPGRYAYCGSAYGPGGLRARLRRHLRPDKQVRWHVDRLTRAGRVIALSAVPGGSECDLFARLLALPGVTVPVPGFGSSDCRRCPAHLAALPAERDLVDIAALELDDALLARRDQLK